MSMAMYVKNSEKDTLEEAFQEALKFEKKLLSLKGSSNSEPSKDKGKSKISTSKSGEDKNPSDSMDMESLQRIIKNLSNDLVDLKRGNGEGSSNQKRFFKFPPKKDSNTPPTNKASPSQMEGINMEDISRPFKPGQQRIWLKTLMREMEVRNNKNNPRILTSWLNNKLNGFWDISFGEDEEEVEEVHVSQNVITTRSVGKNIPDNTPDTPNLVSPTTTTPKQPSLSTNTTPNSSKNTSSNPKTIDQTTKSNTSPTPLAKLEYDFLEDLKKTKANISLFELMKIPQIQENFIRMLQGKTSPSFRESNSGTKRVITKVTFLITILHPKVRL
jgi:hypothetical protein